MTDRCFDKCVFVGKPYGVSQESYCQHCSRTGESNSDFYHEDVECEHVFGDQYRTQYTDIYGKKCKKCGFVKFDKGEKISDCGCRFENDHSNAVILCEECSKLPCHNLRGTE